MPLADITRYLCVAFYTAGSFGGLVYLINLVRRNRRDTMRRVQVLQTAETTQRPERAWRVPVRPTPRNQEF